MSGSDRLDVSPKSQLGRDSPDNSPPLSAPPPPILRAASEHRPRNGFVVLPRAGTPSRLTRVRSIEVPVADDVAQPFGRIFLPRRDMEPADGALAAFVVAIEKVHEDALLGFDHLEE